MGRPHLIRRLPTQHQSPPQNTASIESYLRRALVELGLTDYVDLSTKRLEGKKGLKCGIKAGKNVFKKTFKDCLMYTSPISGNDESNTTPSLVLMKVNVNTLFGGSIMPQNLSSEANALDTEMQSGLMWVVVVAVDNSKETMNDLGRPGGNNYGDLILTSANMSRMGPFIRCKLENLCDAVDQTSEILVLQGMQ